MTETAVYHFDAIEATLSSCKNRHNTFETKSFQEMLYARLNDLLIESDFRRVLSLDVFDTLLLRDNSSELTRFYGIGKEMAQIATTSTGRSVAAVDAFLARHFGTRSTYRCRDRRQGFGEGSLTEIHNTSSRLLAGDDSLSVAFIEAELNYEATRTLINSALANYMKSHRAAGGKVVLVTDMYMHAPQVSKLLGMHGLDESDYDFLISSADERLSKASGRLFKIVEEQLGAHSDDFVHLGDSLKGDMQMAIAGGWRALHLPLSANCISERRADHLRTKKHLFDEFGLVPEIAIPG